MKALSMATSSPSRAESFHPPLMSFLSSNMCSKSCRRRSRSSPIVNLRRQRNSAAAIGATQEPSSPKVTCIGQVRPGSGGAAVRRRWRLKKGLLCGRFILSRLYSERRVFWKWASLFRANYCKKVDAAEDCVKVVCSNQESGKSEKGEDLVSESDVCSKKSRNGLILNGENAEEMKKIEDSMDIDEEDLKGFVGVSIHPLMLTRSKSQAN